MVTEAASSSDVSIPSSSSTTSGTESDVSPPCIGFQGADQTLSVDKLLEFIDSTSNSE